MRFRTIIFIFAIGLSINIVVRDGLGQTKITKIDFCQFALRSNIRDGHATFDLRYTFTVDGDGKPQEIADISALPSTYVAKDIVVACLSEWRLPDAIPGQKVLAIFDWQHGIGWNELNVVGKGFRNTIKISGERCPYTRTEKAQLKKNAYP